MGLKGLPPKKVQKRSRRPAKVKVTTAEGSSVVASSSIRRRARKKLPRLPLTRDQRAELFNGGHPRIVLPAGHRPFNPGDIYQLPGASNLWLGIIGVEEVDDGEGVLHYVPYDERPRLMRASVHGVDFEAIRRGFDEKGNAIPLDQQDQEAIRDAAEESAYTSSPGAALSQGGEEIHRQAHDELAQKARETREERVRHKIRAAHEAIGAMENDDDFKAHASTVRFLRNKVKRLERELIAEVQTK